MLCQKKTKKKESIPPFKTVGTKKKLKKKRPITSACDGWTRVGHRFIPAI